MRPVFDCVGWQAHLVTEGSSASVGLRLDAAAPIAIYPPALLAPAAPRGWCQRWPLTEEGKQMEHDEPPADGPWTLIVLLLIVL